MTLIQNIKFDATSEEDTYVHKWYPHNKGGSFRKWYGNYDYVINWKNAGYDIKHFTDSKGKLKSRPQNIRYFFKKGISWSDLTMGNFGARYVDKGFTFNVSGPTFVPFDEKNLLFVLGYFNSKVFQSLLDISCQGLHYHNGIIASLPICENNLNIDEIVESAILISKEDWNEKETSWEFKRHPLLHHYSCISRAYDYWEKKCDKRFEKLKSIEIQLNKVFIEVCNLENEIPPNVENQDVSLKIINVKDAIISLISYAVGCMFGRYTLDIEGLAYAGGDWQEALATKYKTFIPDEDAIIPITDEEYFKDDIVARFVDFVRIVYGEDTLEENLKFIADALGKKGDTSRAIIRNYFLNDFYKDHCNTYSVTGSGKRPIYWLFDSGKQNGFKALIYIHRYTPDTVGLIRSKYLHNAQAAIQNALQNSEYIIASTTSATERARETKKRDKYIKQLNELRPYYQALTHIALQRIPMDLDDGVKKNYQLFQNVEISTEGKKKQSINLLAKI